MPVIYLDSCIVVYVMEGDFQFSKPTPVARCRSRSVAYR